jgi:uncharacterized SAM-binding protein YcdF (DUF218 family)
MNASLLAVWLLPPLAPLLLVCAGLYLQSTSARAGRIMIAGGAGLLLVLSFPVVGSFLLSRLEPPYSDPLQSRADAIVVLGGGTYAQAPEYDGDTVSSASLERLRYAAKLHRLSQKPILVTGGNPRQYSTAESAQMRALLQEWGISVQWAEAASNNTLENARNSYAMLAPDGIRRIYLVTHAWHMPRARDAFESAGFLVVPAPTLYSAQRPLRAVDFVPDAEGLALSARFCREILGFFWYRLQSLFRQGPL